MIRRPPRSPPFPTRRSSDLVIPDELPQLFLDIARHALLHDPKRRWTTAEIAARLSPTAMAATARSEEHTSELQSRLHLVCRLLLEKKKERTYSAQLYISVLA